MNDPRLLSLLHFADSAFPTGGYAHSFGLETYCQQGRVKGREDLERFLMAQLEGAAGPCDATAAASPISFSGSKAIPSSPGRITMKGTIILKPAPITGAIFAERRSLAVKTR